MKLYFSPASCSLASHIVLQELGQPFEIERVDIREKKFSGGDFFKINPKGYVPVLEIDSSTRLTEGAAILQYLADQKPELQLIPARDSFDRYRAQEWLNYVATEVHRGFSPLWSPKVPEEVKSNVREMLFKKFDFLEAHLKKSDFVLGSNFSVVDAYLFTVLNWVNFLKLDLSKWPSLMAFQGRIEKRPSVQNAMKAEGLLK